MKNSSSASNNPSGAPTAESARQLGDTALTSALSSADAGQSDALQNFALIRQARLAQQTRALNAAVVQYGGDSTQAKAAQSVVTASERTAARLQLFLQKAATPQVAVAAQGWALHGRVYDSNLKPLADYAVFLVDEQKNYLASYGFCYTDGTGYFLINYAGAAAASSDQASGSSSEPRAHASAGPALFVEITNPKARPVYLAGAPFQPVPGTATYQVITLPPGEPVLGNPPGEIRKVAIPPRKRSKS